MRSYGSSEIPAPSSLQAPQTRPSTRNVGTDGGFFVAKTVGRCSSGITPVRRAWTSRTASQVGSRRTGAGGLGRRTRHSLKVEQPAGQPAKRDAVERGLEQPPRNAGPGRNVIEARRPEPAEIGPARDGRAPLPRTRRTGRRPARRAHRGRRGASPTCRTAARGRASPKSDVSLPAADRAPWRASALRRACRAAHPPPEHRALRLAIDAQPPLAERAADAHGVAPVLLCGDEMDRRAHQRSRTTVRSHERTRQLIALEALEAASEPDVRVRRVLVLDAAEALDRTRRPELRPLEQELAREQRPVQVRSGSARSRKEAPVAARPRASSARTSRAAPPERWTEFGLLDLPRAGHEAVHEERLARRRRCAITRLRYAPGEDALRSGGAYATGARIPLRRKRTGAGVWRGLAGRAGRS